MCGLQLEKYALIVTFLFQNARIEIVVNMRFLTQNFIPVTRAPNVMRSPDQVDMGRREVTAENGRSAVHIVNLTCTRLTSLSLDPLVFADWVATLTRAPVD